MPRDAHWVKATTVVQRAIDRTSTASSHHRAAAQQLEAAEYALHCLLGELDSVMKTAVGSPLQAKVISITASAPSRRALAA
jgi:hypothetical protein